MYLKKYLNFIYMSEVEELQNEIIVDFNNNDTFSKIKNQVEKEEPKPKRKSTKKKSQNKQKQNQ